MTKIEELRINNLLVLHRMYDMLLDESKYFFHPGFLGFHSLSLKWILAQFALVATSSSIAKRFLLTIYPRAVVFTAVAFGRPGEVIGFAFVRVTSRISKNSFEGELGICIKDEWQGRSIGSNLLKYLLNNAKKNHIRRISLIVATNNTRAIHLYKKVGFRVFRFMRKGDVWRGHRFDSFEMSIDLF